MAGARFHSAEDYILEMLRCCLVAVTWALGMKTSRRKRRNC